MAEKRDRREYMKAYREAHKDVLKKRGRVYQKAYVESHGEKYKESQKLYREAHKEELKEKQRLYHEAHKEQRKEQRKSYYETHKEQEREYSIAYAKLHPDKRKKYDREYYELKVGHAVTRRLTNEQILKAYYDHPDYTFKQLAEELHLSEATVKTRVGLALMEECRIAPDCPMKALLPEYREEKTKKTS